MPLSRAGSEVRTSVYIRVSVVLRYSRGIPLGFLNTLEARLRETEMALIAVVQQSNNQGQLHHNNAILPLPEARSQSSQQKTEMANEWTQFPLQSMDDIIQWYRWKTASLQEEEARPRRLPRRLERANPRETPTIPQQRRPPLEASSINQDNWPQGSQNEDHSVADSGDIQDLLATRPSIYF